VAGFASALGFIGVAIVLVAYYLLAAGKLTNDNWRYPVLNIVGTVGIIASLLQQWNLPGMVAQLVWIAISIVGIMRIMKKRVR
jgi:hypothetical protein